MAQSRLLEIVNQWPQTLVLTIRMSVADPKQRGLAAKIFDPYQVHRLAAQTIVKGALGGLQLGESRISAKLRMMEMENAAPLSPCRCAGLAPAVRR